jgi:ubiquinone/menaquinone biosynthesis C-methylase UbiE
MKLQSASQPHSAEQFGPQRDFWWNRDFLDLMARRWRLGEASSLADIGCGRCHWSRLLYPSLRQPARLAAIDREARWVAEGEQHFRHAFPDVANELLTFRQGLATAIPLPDDSHDVVTCQTVLMHLAEPVAALREMLRVLRPGGLLICVEPNNFWNYIPFTSVTATEPTEKLAQKFEFWLRCHRGRIALGEGDHAVGDLLPGYFAQLGLADISVYQSDRAAPLYPPYDSPAQQAIIENERQAKDSGSGPWNRAEILRLFNAGGGTTRDFDKLFDKFTEQYDREQTAIAAKAFHAGGGSIQYIVSGRKRE